MVVVVIVLDVPLSVNTVLSYLFMLYTLLFCQCELHSSVIKQNWSLLGTIVEMMRCCNRHWDRQPWVNDIQ